MLVSNSLDHGNPVNIDPESLNILISCQVKARALKAVLQLEEFCRNSCIRSLSNTTCQDGSQNSQMSAVRPESPPKIHAWPKTFLNLSVPTSRFARLFGHSIVKESELTHKPIGEEKLKKAIRIPDIRKSMIFYPSSHDLKRLIGLLVENEEKKQAVEILERHVLLYRTVQSVQSIRHSSFFYVTKTDLQDLDEAICLVSPTYFANNEIDGLIAVVVCCGCLPISSSMLISKLEEKRMTSRVNALLECMNEKTRLAITSTYSALIATWAARKR
ncbi:3-hydroxy-3-methylglutaryl-CoA reductase [Perkinsela sp. CCAP 1560/4]|nr:3-hydroxy-3-methylglutaryl-CoA reductase [Perkinsela sp. CCAP 1560/4]|eukprot:KNH05473.1 3-hydroxy-3-methylglutaryl-CoA reductase [Perkinsela sp. CCAP 1560/4]